jgi:hypothetical protein
MTLQVYGTKEPNPVRWGAKEPPETLSGMRSPLGDPGFYI